MLTSAGLFNTPKLYPAGSAEPKQHVAPAKTNKVVHLPDPGSISFSFF